MSFTHHIQPDLQISRGNTVGLWILFLSVLAWVSIGILPFVPMNGNAAGIVNGIESARLGGSYYDGYRYAVQPGIFLLIDRLSSYFEADSYFIFSLLSAGSGLGFIVMTALFLSGITGLPTPLCGLLVLLFPESYAAMFYPNSKAVAALFAISSLLLLSRTSKLMVIVFCGFLFGIAACIRFSLLLVTPASLFLLYRGDWLQTIARTTLLASITVISAFLPLIAFNIDPWDIVREVTIHGQSAAAANWFFDITVVASFFGFLLPIFILLGLLLMIRRRYFRLLGTFLFGISGFIFFYFGKIHSPKYMYALIPFFSIPIAVMLQYLLTHYKSWTLLKKYAFTSIFGILFVFQMFIGIRVYQPEWIVTPTWAHIVQLRSGNVFKHPKLNRVDVVIGSGQLVATGDLQRTINGWFFLPLLWHNWKSEVRIHQEYVLRETNQFTASPLIFAAGWDRQQVMKLLLFRDGYKPEGDSVIPGVIRWRKNERSVYLFMTADGMTSLPNWFNATKLPDLMF